MKKIKIADAPNRVIDWLVAKAEGVQFVLHRGEAAIEEECDPDHHAHEHDFKQWKMWTFLRYTTDPAQAWPIIEREEISIERFNDFAGSKWAAEMYDPNREHQHKSFGPTSLVAAMRCYCASVYGDEAEVPEELL